MEFVSRIAESFGIPANHVIVRYFLKKTKAVDSGSKARRSLANLYVLHVLAEDFLEGRESRHSDLMARMRAMPFGAKLQNHALDNRLNGEFENQMDVPPELYPVQMGKQPGLNSRVMSRALLTDQGSDPVAVASFIVEVVDTYVSLINDKQTGALADVDKVEDLAGLKRFFEAAFAPKADARLFEVASFVLLADHYSRLTVWIGDAQDTTTERPYTLFKTGRTNANDGGIDFVLKPAGRFFQVTETLNFKKYFLDLDKVNRFQITFVIKSELTPDAAIARIRNDAVKSGRYDKAQVAAYLLLFEELFTLPSLRDILEKVPASNYASIKADLTLQFQLEYGLLD